MEAQYIKQIVDQLSMREQANYNKIRNSKINHYGSQLAHKHKLEMNALNRKLKDEYDDLQFQKLKEEEKFVMKTKNVKRVTQSKFYKE